MVLYIAKNRDENPVGVWTLNIKDSNANSNIGNWNHWSITFWGASSKPQIIARHNSKVTIIKQHDVLKNATNTSTISGDAKVVEIHESYPYIIFGILCLIVIIIGMISATTFWKRITRQKNRSSLANEERYIPIEDELDDAFLESQLRDMIDEDI